MIKAKNLIVMVLVLGLFNITFADKRPKPKSMKELTDPKSPSYVPFPYPKKRGEIIADLKYYADKYCNDNPDKWIGEVPATEIILKKLLEPKPIYTIGKIIKVKNRTAKLSHDYSWLIYIMDKDGDIAMHVAMDAYGLFTEGAAVREEDIEMVLQAKDRKKMERFRKYLNDRDIKNILSESIDCTIDYREIKKMERLAYFSPLGDFLFPLWEIKMSDGTIYYYSITREMVYAIEKKIHWKKDKNGYRANRLSLVPHMDFLPDSINDELIVLKKIPRKTKK
ncbi:MAG: hypothetical protein GTO45_29325 [Candidatus Aminicenantes bacterium]|nr:hypothetical protein [Candidatus Aminicenantes bacterium]NIM82895.1 hypothetical protein [Candidatus Aminicenantes bacterium]NIN22271.1 hypothetical protein [Candidatus Aminicenantes bacterium]NIN46039.1 hypothetical protein [Candidatus Aminicenantes bacterium]NIN88875.1 hypothetical protein [Candidatus Aminicenantes bacterium]